MANDPTHCRPQRLAEEGNVRIDLCGCGQVHVTLGAITVRLRRTEYLVLCQTLAVAARNLPEPGIAAVH